MIRKTEAGTIHNPVLKKELHHKVQSIVHRDNTKTPELHLTTFVTLTIHI